MILAAWKSIIFENLCTKQQRCVSGEAHMAMENEANQCKTSKYKAEFSQNGELCRFGQCLLLYQKKAGIRYLSNGQSRKWCSNFLSKSMLYEVG